MIQIILILLKQSNALTTFNFKSDLPIFCFGAFLKKIS